ncbi:MAG: nuclear transport factor 2 family protein [Bacteroidetes bacterium]|nr:MAG: nuclear transport factor 2 family protein [Bacteroidota bacterium]
MVSGFDAFINFYADTVILEDIITGVRVEGKADLIDFFDWNNPNFSKTQDQVLVLEMLFVDGKQSVAKGYFTPFRWGEHYFEAMYFTTLLTFNESGKIVRQVDWFNYPSNLVDYQNRKNANLWINQ